MLRLHLSRFGSVLLLVFGLCVFTAQAQEFRYRYVSFDQVKLPEPFTFFYPAAFNNSGRVYGTVCDDVCSDPRIAFYQDGAVTVRQAVGFAGTVNAGGTVGGLVLIDPQNFVAQAALFRGDKVEVIPPQPGEVFSFVIALNDQGTALVESDDANGTPTYVLYSRGQTTVLDFGPTVTNPRFISYVSTGRFINNAGVIAGTTGTSIFDGAKGFRFDSRTGKTKLLKPLPTENLAWGLGINNRGDVLGYSFVSGAPYHERVGVWDRNGHFKTYFNETISSQTLVFNDNNLIVITLAPGNNSYLVPRPGVRLPLADLVENLSSGQNLRYIFDINNHGNMLGSDDQGRSFLLERVSAARPHSLAAPDAVIQPTEVQNNERHRMPAAISAMLRRHSPPLKSSPEIPQDAMEGLPSN